MRQQLRTTMALALFVLVGWRVAERTAAHAVYNWDVIPYLVATQAWSGSSIASAHANTYAILEKNLPAATFDGLAKGSSYRQTLASDPSALAEQLPFYTVKPAYIAALGLSLRLGVPLHRAPYAVATLSYFFVLAGIACWIYRLQSSATVWVAGALIALSPSLLEAAWIATPDCLSAAVLVWAGYALMRGRHAWFVTLALTSVSVRPDNAVWLLGVMAVLATRRPWRASLLRGGGLVAAAMVVIGTIKVKVGGYPWWTTFSHSFLGRIDHPGSWEGPFSWPNYLGAVWRGAMGEYAYGAVTLPLVAFAAAAAFACSHREHAARRILGAIIAGGLGTIPLRLLLHPDLSDRLFAGPYTLVLLSALSLQVPMRKGLSETRGQAATP